MILAIDSSAGTAVAVTDPEGHQRSLEETLDRRSHAEVIGPFIQRALSSAGIASADVTAVVMGVGPGPFTGLRVGIAAAQAFAWARSLPLWPVLSHDAAATLVSNEMVVISDARRGEWACTRYRPHPDGGVGARVGDSFLVPRAAITDTDTQWDGARIVRLDQVNPAQLVRASVARRTRGEDPQAPRPVYLREPDVTMPQ